MPNIEIIDYFTPDLDYTFDFASKYDGDYYFSKDFKFLMEKTSDYSDANKIIYNIPTDKKLVEISQIKNILPSTPASHDNDLVSGQEYPVSLLEHSSIYAYRYSSGYKTFYLFTLSQTSTNDIITVTCVDEYGDLKIEGWDKVEPSPVLKGFKKDIVLGKDAVFRALAINGTIKSLWFYSKSGEGIENITLENDCGKSKSNLKSLQFKGKVVDLPNYNENVKPIFNKNWIVIDHGSYSYSICSIIATKVVHKFTLSSSEKIFVYGDSIIIQKGPEKFQKICPNL